MKRIKMRDHNVHFEHYLVAGEAEIVVARKHRTTARTGRKTEETSIAARVNG